MHLDVVAQLRHDVFAGRRFLRHLDVVFLPPADEPAGTGPAGLHAGAAGKNDHDVFAKSFLVILNALAQALARCDHHGDGDDAPGDAEHRKHGSALVGPKRGQRIPQ